MTARRPLVIVSGVTQELPTGDTITGASSATSLTVLTRAITYTTVSIINSSYIPVLNRNGTTYSNVGVT